MRYARQYKIADCTCLAWNLQTYWTAQYVCVYVTSDSCFHLRLLRVVQIVNYS